MVGGRRGEEEQPTCDLVRVDPSWTGKLPQQLRSMRRASNSSLPSGITAATLGFGPSSTWWLLPLQEAKAFMSFKELQGLVTLTTNRSAGPDDPGAAIWAWLKVVPTQAVRSS